MFHTLTSFFGSLLTMLSCHIEFCENVHIEGVDDIILHKAFNLSYNWILPFSFLQTISYF
jgi:hypothetical protein